MIGTYWPSFETEFLSEIGASLKKRGKLIAQVAQVFSCDKVWEQSRHGRCEKMELEFRKYADRDVRVNIEIWQDRTIWIEIREDNNKHRIFCAQREGRIGNIGPRLIQEAILATVKATDYGMSDVSAGEVLAQTWRTIALSGIQGVVGGSN